MQLTQEQIIYLYLQRQIQTHLKHLLDLYSSHFPKPGIHISTI